MNCVQKHWWHATTRENWKKIKKEGLRKGTFLARNHEELIRMINLPLIGDLRKCELILSVLYTQKEKDEGWELIISEPIPAENVKRVHSLTVEQDPLKIEICGSDPR